jgi:cobalt-zinc-cadmium efflux system membrane fusion protein
MRSLAGFFSLTLLLAACDSAPAPAPAPPPLMPATATATPASELLLAELPATVVQPPGSRVAVAAPLAGLVREVLVQPGQAVSKGQLLAVLVSREALVMAGDVARAGARAEVASAEAARMQALAREGVVAAARAEAARAAGTEADVNRREAALLLARAGADADGLVRLRAPIAGRVAEMRIEAGAPLDGQSAPFVIEAGGSRWLALQIPERLADTVRPGLVVRTASGQQGRLETVAATLDPQTRAFAARARLSDDGPLLTSGALLRISLHAPAPEGAVAVPAAALLQEEARTLVFVKTASGFAPRPVTRAGSGDTAVLSAGLKAGEQVAVSNLPELRVQAGE